MEDDEWVEGLETPLLVDCSDNTLLQQLKLTDSEILFYDPAQDIRNEFWAIDAFGTPRNCILSCPSCFTACAYQTNSSHSPFRSKKVFNIDLPQVSEGSLEPEVICNVCKATLGTYSILKDEYTLTNVLTGSG